MEIQDVNSKQNNNSTSGLKELTFPVTQPFWPCNTSNKLYRTTDFFTIPSHEYKGPIHKYDTHTAHCISQYYSGIYKNLNS